MSRLRRMWGWLEPGLIYMDPLSAVAYHAAMAATDTPVESVSADRTATVSRVELSSPPRDEYFRPRVLQADKA